MSSPFTPQNYLRYLILCNGAITYEQALAKWKKQFPDEKKEVTQQNYYQARSSLKIKYGVDDVGNLPHKTNGTPNISALVRLMLVKKAGITFKQCQTNLASDGVILTKENWRAVNASLESALKSVKDQRIKPTKSVLKEFGSMSIVEGLPDGDPNESPDEKQHVGHRAKLSRVRRVGRHRHGLPDLPSVVIEPGADVLERAVTKSVVRSDMDLDLETQLAEIENNLDLVIENALNTEYIEDLRKARRLISKTILGVTE